MSPFSRCFGLLAMLIVGFLALATDRSHVTAIPLAGESVDVNATAAPVKRSIVTNRTRLYNMSLVIDKNDLLEEYGWFMMSNMNKTISPCENFYQYACGNWEHSEIMPPEVRNDSFLHSVQTRIDKMMLDFLSNTTEADLVAKSAEAKAKRFYRSCVDQNKQMEDGYKSVLAMDEFTGSLSGKKGNKKIVDWINVNFISRFGMFVLLPLKSQYSTETRKFEVVLNPPREVLGKPDIVNVKNLTRDFKIEGEENQQKFAEELDLMIELEQNLTFYAFKRNQTEELTLQQFLEKYKDDRMNWERYFQVAFNGTARGDWVINNNIDRVSGIVRHLEKMDLGLLRDYVKWRTLIKFYYIWKAEADDKSVHSTCREHTETYFNYALMPWFIDTIYSSERRTDLLSMADSLKKKFYELIEQNTWLDDNTKSSARAKLMAMDIEAGYRDELRHRKYMDLIFADTNITHKNFFKNLEVLEENRAQVRLRSVNKALIPPLMSTLKANAYYADFLNLAFVAIGISQLPFYHISFPPSLKFGGIGNIIGHEMAHGFDSYCYKFNYNGKKENWWSENSLRNFQERYQCLESQYNKYVYHGMATNGTLTLGDNIADNVGTRISYYTYMGQNGRVDGNRRPIRGMNLTNKQLFFLKFAQTWCTGKDESHKMRRFRTDTHAYEEFRVMGTLSNMPEFSEAYNCKLGTNMNPVKKCKIW